ncbi:MAG: 6-phosphogluconolactonase [bacterium]
MERNIQVYSSKSELVKAVTEKIINAINRSVYQQGVCYLALAGGNTPRDVYSLVAKEHVKNHVSWNNVHLFWGDERTVPPDHPESNYGMVKHSLLDHIAIPAENIHRIPAEMAPRQAAEEYTRGLHGLFKEMPPHFDLILLGVGGDGHTASLFPGTDVLNENSQPVAAVFVPKLNTWRVTLTLPVLNAAREIIFLVSGSSKSEIVRRIMSVEQPTKELPASLIHPENGMVHWMLDSDAAIAIQNRV